ncbi:UNVERIFIED_CONTAM: hypothetical protein Sradi_2479300 [Sesamum radiatum]|uniref:Retrotransposon gag domain-containing protein n=1 Tax=Sesamum radiatum TaxID=300843 RepID=A0AAW2SKD8_SESRA
MVQSITNGEIGSFQEFRSLFFYQFVSNRKYRTTKLSLFVVPQKEGESLKDYLYRFNTAALEVLLATQEVKTSILFKSLSK